MKRILSFFLTVALSAALLAPGAAAVNEAVAKDTDWLYITIDPGHGGSDVGATSVDKVYDEKHINLSVAKYLQSYLESAGVNVIMVRDTLEEGSDLTLRGKVMERYQDTADLFFSVHHNAANTAARGGP